jgi:hypothetical protein
MPSQNKKEKKNRLRNYQARMLNLPNPEDTRWREKAPRLTEDQKAKLAQITGEAREKHAVEITRFNFGEIHERMEEEIFNRVIAEMGMWSALEWRGVFSKRNYAAYLELNPKAQPYVDGILPLEHFLRSDMFDHIELFQPRVVVLSFADYTQHIDSTERSVKEAEDRRAQGDAYFTNRDQAIHYVPAPTTDEGGVPGEGAEDV